LASNKSGNSSKTNPVKSSNLLAPAPVGPPPPVPSRPSKEKMNKSKFHGKSKEKTVLQCSYTQAFLDNIKEILKIKESFSQLLNKKVEEVYKTIKNSSKSRLCINITTKGPLCKQIIIPMRNNNILTFMKSSGKYMANINCTLKDVKSDNFVDFIHSDH